MVEFDTILELCRVLRIAQSFPKLEYVNVSLLFLPCGVFEALGLVGSKGIEPMVGDGSPWGWTISWGVIML